MEPTSSPSSVVIDVTETSRLPYLTGVQRLVRETVSHAPEDCRLVRFNPQSQQFHFVKEIPELVFRSWDSPAGRLKLFIRNLVPNRVIRSQSRQTSTPRTGISYLLRLVYFRYFSDSYLVKDKTWKKAPAWHPRATDHYVTLEIQDEPSHRNAIRRILALDGVTSTFYVHDIIPLSHPELFSREDLLTLRSQFLEYAGLALSSSEIVANSRATLENFLELKEAIQPDSKVASRVLYPPLRPNGHTGEGKPATTATSKKSADRIRLLGVGSLDVRKNFIVVLRALPILQTMGKTTELTMVGGANKAIDPEIKDFLSSLSDHQRANIEIVSSASDEELDNHYESADIVVVPSKAEGFGLPILEAAVRGRTVIAADSKVAKEVGEGLDVFYADSSNPVAWAEVIISVSEGTAATKISVDSLSRFPRSSGEFARRLLALSVSDFRSIF